MVSTIRQRFKDALRGFRVLGPRDFMKVLFNAWTDRFDSAHPTTTNGYMAVPESLAATGAGMYAPSRPRPFRLLMESLPEREGAFVDYGCGKGRALIMAAAAGFRVVKGLELDPGLLETARRNLRAVDLPEERGILLARDARTYEPTPEDRFFYFYDPFDDRTLFACLERIKHSLELHPRAVTVVMLHNLREDWRPISEILGRFTPEVRRFAGEQFGIYRFRQ